MIAPCVALAAGDPVKTHITLTFMGGGTLEIPINEINDAGYIKGRSMMPEGLADGITEQDIIDLLAYLRSIK